MSPTARCSVPTSATAETSTPRRWNTTSTAASTCSASPSRCDASRTIAPPTRAVAALVVSAGVIRPPGAIRTRPKDSPMQHRLIAMFVTATLVAVAGCKRDDAPAPSPAAGQATQTADETTLTDWPRVESAIKADPAIEARIKEILAGMNLRQKVGQMTQSEIKTTKPEDVQTYYLGSVLNGGGSWPAMNKHAAVGDWVALADGFYDGSIATDLKVKIPVIWGTDAVHGHSNVYGATIYPHNIGLGAAHDPALVEKIAAV